MRKSIAARRTGAMILALVVLLMLFGPGLMNKASAETAEAPFGTEIVLSGDTATVSVRSTAAFEYASLELKFRDDLTEGVTCTSIRDGADIADYQPSEPANISTLNGLYAIDIDVVNLDNEVEVPAGKELAVYVFDLSEADPGSHTVTFVFSAASDIEGRPLEWQKATISVVLTKAEPSPGSDVNGTAISWNGTDNARYFLYAADEADVDIKTDMWIDSPLKALYTGVGGSVTANADGKRFDQGFTFEAIPDGTYKLAIAKPGKYVPKIVQITVSGGAFDAGEVKLWLYGDINYDGRIRTGDATQIYRMLAGERTFTEDEFSAADISGDGRIRTGDATQIYKFLAGESSKFDDFA